MFDNLRYDFNAIADIEERAGQGVGSLFAEEKMGLNTIRLLVWGGMRHIKKGWSVEAAGLEIQTYLLQGGTIQELTEKIAAAVEKSGLFGNFTQAEG